MPCVNPSRIYFAVAPENRQAFANCFSGNLDEAPIQLVEPTTGKTWWGANGNYDLALEVDRMKLAQSQAWYCCVVFNIAGIENPDGMVLDSNCGFPAGVPDPEFDAFLAACGLEKVQS